MVVICRILAPGIPTRSGSRRRLQTYSVLGLYFMRLPQDIGYIKTTPLETFGGYDQYIHYKYKYKSGQFLSFGGVLVGEIIMGCWTGRSDTGA